jgi:hypothetical protein
VWSGHDPESTVTDRTRTGARFVFRDLMIGVSVE